MRKKVICLLIVITLFPSLALAEDVLTLDKFIRSTVEINPGYQISAQDYLIALQDNESVKSLEDWNLIASGMWNESTPAPISSFSSNYQKTTSYSISAKKYIARTGTEIKLEHSNTGIEAEYPTMTIPGIGTFDFNPPPEYYLSNISLTITQPLLRNAFGLATRNALKMSDYTLQLAEIKLSEDWEDFIAMLRSEYLIWQKCHRNVDLFKDKVKTVVGQLNLVERQKKYGLSEDLDLVQIQQKVEGYRIMLEQAKLACENQTIKILQLIGQAETSPEKIKPEKFKKNELIMKHSSALSYLNTNSNIKKTADIMVELQQTNLKTKENEKLMDLNLVLQATPNAFSENFSESFSKIGDYNDNTISITASRALSNQKAEAEAKKAKSEYEKAVKQREDILLSSKIGLSSLYTSLKYLNSMLELNENNLKLARERLKLEKKKFDQGRSTIFFVLQAEDDVLAAENTLNENLFAREEIINQIKALTDRYLVEYKDILRL